MAAYLLKPTVESNEGDTVVAADVTAGAALSAALSQAVEYRAVNHRLVTIVLALLFFIGSMNLAQFLPTSLFEAGNTSRTSVSISLPPGTTLEKTEMVSDRITNLLLARPATEDVFMTNTPGEASAAVQLKPKNERIERKGLRRGAAQRI